MSTSTRPLTPDGRHQPTLLELTSDPVPGDQSCSIVGNQPRMPFGKAASGNARSAAPDRQSAQKNKPLFRLYITRGENASARALANLRKICREHLDGQYDIEIVDVGKDPRRTEKDGVTTTPTLIKWSPAPAWTIVGDLSEDAAILEAMKRKGPARRTP